MEKDNTTMVLDHFIGALAIPLTRQTLYDDLQKHPDYNSLLVMSEVFDNWHVLNVIYQLRFEEPLPLKLMGRLLPVFHKKFCSSK